MLKKYRKHGQERAADEMLPLTLNAQQTANAGVENS